MNRVCALPVVFLLGSLTAMAQTSGTAPTLADQAAAQAAAQAVLRLTPLQANDCPAGIKVEEAGIPRLVYIKTAPPAGSAIGVRFRLSNSRSVGIAGVRITVHGYTQAHSVGTAVSRANPGEVGKTFRLALQVAPGGEASTELWVQGFVSVSSVDLDAVIYADGSRWSPSPGRQCSVISPNLNVGDPGR